MKVTILGCGGAGGVPLIGNNWGACDPDEPKNMRTRVSILVQEDETTLLVDTSPDMRQQLLRSELKDLDAILYTHAHADHSHGIDNIRSLNWMTRKPMPIYASQETMEELKFRFSYIFEERSPETLFYRPSVEPHLIEKEMQIGSIAIKTFDQYHGKVTSTGYRFNDFGYTTDAGQLDDEAFEILKGVKVWVLDAIREKPHHTHAHVDMALEWIERLKPERAFLTHMDHTLDYATLKKKLPEGVEPAYDGLVIEC